MGSDSVHVGDSLLGKRLAHSDVSHFFVRVLELELYHSDETSSFELGKAVANVLTGSLTGVFGVSTVSLVSTVVLTKSVDSDLLSHVDLVGNGGGTVVEPVTVDWRKFPSAGSLDVGGPLKNIIVNIAITELTVNHITSARAMVQNNHLRQGS